ncbi:MAG: glycosyltransferase family 2 protein [Planctomycetaceae bacterium]|nr:glycosyltransferase family 2 protein [Planctomycetaceae bacterium]
MTEIRPAAYTDDMSRLSPQLSSPELPGTVSDFPGDRVPDTRGQPFVSLVIPVRNEASHIRQCLNTIAGNDWPPERMEIIVVDGMSTDSTRDVIGELAARDDRIQIVDNPHQSVPFAMNIGIRAARGEIVIRVDGHAEVASDFIRHSVEQLLQHSDCWCVGGPIQSVNENLMGRIIAASQSCPVGVGNSRFRTGNYEGYVDTLAFGAYWKWVFEKIGLFDEELVRNQDDELNARLREAGGKIWLSSRIQSRYFSRTSLLKLWRQYYQYGVWRIRTLQKRGTASVRYLIPMFFVSAVLLTALVAAAFPVLRIPAIVFAVAYMTALLSGAAMVARRTGPAGFLLSPMVFAILHFSYGFGSLFGILWFSVLRRRTLTHGLSR